MKAVLSIYAHDVRLHLKGEPHKLLRIPAEHVKEMSFALLASIFRRLRGKSRSLQRGHENIEN